MDMDDPAKRPQIDLSHLPAGAEHFLGRGPELAALDQAWTSGRIHLRRRAHRPRRHRQDRAGQTLAGRPAHRPIGINRGSVSVSESGHRYRNRGIGIGIAIEHRQHRHRNRNHPKKHQPPGKAPPKSSAGPSTAKAPATTARPRKTCSWPRHRALRHRIDPAANPADKGRALAEALIAAAPC
jgi:hypothetical protein